MNLKFTKKIIKRKLVDKLNYTRCKDEKGGKRKGEKEKESTRYDVGMRACIAPLITPSSTLMLRESRGQYNPPGGSSSCTTRYSYPPLPTVSTAPFTSHHVPRH